MKKIYLVIESGGEYEDYWEDVVGVSSSKELAEKLVNQIKKKYEAPESIDYKKWDSLVANVIDYEYDNNVSLGSIVEGVHKLFPEYDIKDIKQANLVYDNESDWNDVIINEVDLIENESDLNSIINAH